MAITSSLQRLLDRKQWEMCNSCPTASVTGASLASSTLWDQFQFYVLSTTTAYLYYPADDAWLQLTSPAATAGPLGATFSPIGPTGTALGGGTSTITLNAATNITGPLANYVIRLTGGTGAGQERVIASNTFGTSAVVTVTTPWTVTPDVTTTYTLLTGRFYAFFGSTTVAPTWKSYDIATNTWTALGTTNLPATWGTDANVVFTYGGNASASGASVGGNIFANGTSTGTNTTTTLNNTGKAWTANQWTNYQVRILAGTGAGQFRTIASNTGTALTVSAAWTVTPDATSVYVIEGNDDFAYLIGNNAVTMYRYSVSGNTWTVLAPGVARGGAPVAGQGLVWVTQELNSAWTGENAILNGRRLYSPRGTSTAIDYYDIPGNTWVGGITYQRSGGESWNTGSQYTQGPGGAIYIHNAGSRYFKFQPSTQALDAISVLPYGQSTAIIGSTRMFTLQFRSGNDTLLFLYHLRNTGNELFRCLLF